MGKRKRLMAEGLKEAKKVTAIAKLNDVPTSPRKMRLVADTIRGKEVNLALDMLKFSKREASIKFEKLLRSAGFALSPASVFDLICRYFFENAPADPDRVNDALWTYRQPLVCGVRLD